MSGKREQLRKAAALAAEGKAVAVIARHLRAAQFIADDIEAVNPAAVSSRRFGSNAPAMRYKSGGIVLLLTYRSIDRLRGWHLNYLLTEDELTHGEHMTVGPSFRPGEPCIEVLEQ